MQINTIESILLFGANDGIGAALLQEYLELPNLKSVYCPIRSGELPADSRVVAIHFDTLNEESIQQVLKDIPQGSLDLVVNTIGYIENELGGPEKSLREINEQKLLEYFRVNAIFTPMIAKHSKALLKRKGEIGFLALSAMVGSIGENDLGGWYGYRASKAALNMFIKTIAIELKRYNPESLVLSMHPGTTHTKMTRNYIAGVKHQTHQPADSASHINQVFFNTPLEKSGCFFNWDGREIAY
jgi:NAD(P)-dependent dehydrogenase (short-subunit alcohol dehydrogenase family)